MEDRPTTNKLSEQAFSGSKYLNKVAISSKNTDVFNMRLCFAFCSLMFMIACANVHLPAGYIQDVEVAEKNAERMRTLVQAREGYLQEIGEHLQMMRWLAVEAGKNSFPASQRVAFNARYSKHIVDIQTIILSAEYKDLPLLNERAMGYNRITTFKIQPEAPALSMELNGLDPVRPLGFEPDGQVAGSFKPSIMTSADAQASVEYIDKALRRVLYDRMVLGGWYNRLEHAEKIIVMHKQSENLQDEVRQIERSLTRLAADAVQDFFTPDDRQGVQAEFDLLVAELRRTKAVYGESSNVIQSLREDENVLTIASAESLRQKLISITFEPYNIAH